MPWDVVKDTNACPASKPWAVKNKATGDVNGRCHESQEKAQAQQRALYAALKREEGMSEHLIVPLEKLFSDGMPTEADNVKWVQAFPYDTWDHPLYGETTVDTKKAEDYIANFKNNVRGQELATGYEHGEDKAKGNKASGWIRDMEARDNGVFFKVEFTPTAIDEIKNGEWKYFSTEVYDTWTHPHTKVKYSNVISGGTLTNKPWVKNMLPINFSEVVAELNDEEKAEASALTKMQDLSNYEKAKLSEAMEVLRAHDLKVVAESKEWEHSEPGTGPAPVQIPPEKDAETGSRRPDLPEGFPDTLIEDQFAESDDSAVKSLAEAVVALREDPGVEAVDWVRNARFVLENIDTDTAKKYTEIAGLFSKHPRATGFNANGDLTPEKPEGGKSVDETTERQLRQMFDVDVNGDLVEAAKLKFGELSALKNAVAASEQEREFAERYPQLWDEHNELMKRDRANAAKNFSESVAKVRKSEGVGLKDTRQGLSSKALDSIREVHMKFSEGSATVADFEDCIKAITNGGILEFAERGSANAGDEPIPEIDGNSAAGVADSRQLMANLVEKEMAEMEEPDLLKASEAVAAKHPELARAYRVTLPA